MARASWNIHDPDIVGAEFEGVGYTGHAIFSQGNWRALRFTAQRTGEVDQVALYSGRNTVNPPLSATHFFGRRAPFIVELIPISGFDPGGVHSIDLYTSTVVSAAGVVDHNGAAVFSDELAAANDNKFLISTGSTLAIADVQMSGASAFPLDRQVLSVAIETNFLRQMRVARLDQDGLYYWNRVLPAGVQTWHMGEARIEHGDPSLAWRLWTPSEIRQFAGSVGNRKLRAQALSRPQPQIIDLLRIHVDSIPERRAGVGIMDTGVQDGWVTVELHAPNVTGTPAHITEGTEYALLVRSPAGGTDYATLARYELQSLSDRRTPTTYQHFGDLDWDLRAVNTWDIFTRRSLGGLVNGLAAVRLLNNGAQTVDSQPYERTVGARVYDGQQATQQDLGISSPSTEYARLRCLVSADFNPGDALEVTVTGAAFVTGPHTITPDQVVAGPLVGVDELGHQYREVIVPFGQGLTMPNPVDVVFQSITPISEPWLVSGLASRILPGTGDQTFVGTAGGSFATGVALDPTSTLVTGLDSYGQVDLQVALLAQAPEITGVDVAILQQPVTGGACEPCGPDQPLGCSVLAIPYPQLCWNPSTLPLADFSNYEVQRSEQGGDWVTVAAPTVTGAPLEPVRGRETRSTTSSTAHVAASVDAFGSTDRLFCVWQSFGPPPGNYTVPGSMTAGPETDGASFSTMRSAHQTIGAAGPTGTRTATFSLSDRWSSCSAVVRGRTAAPTIEQTLSGVSAGNVVLNTAAGTQVGWWLLAIQGWDESDDPQMRPPSGTGWQEIADSGFIPDSPPNPSTSRTRIWARRVVQAGVQSVTFYDGLDVADNHAHLFVLSGVDTLLAADHVPRCFDDWSLPFETPVRYRVRQQRVDGSVSDWSSEVPVYVPSPPGVDLTITAPADPSLNAAFPEAHGSRLPAESEWTTQDGDDVVFRQVYGRDHQIAFRPLERKGIAFSRRLIVSALCTASSPCLDVVAGLRDLTGAGQPYLVVRDYCGNRWYAAVTTDRVIRSTVPGLKGNADSVWLVDIQVTELVTPEVQVPVPA